MARWIGSACLAIFLLAACAAVSSVWACVGSYCGKAPFGTPEPEAVVPPAVLPELDYITKIEVPEPVTPGSVFVPIAGTNTCALAFNNACDDPGKCAPGTDAHDCSPGAGK